MSDTQQTIMQVKAVKQKYEAALLEKKNVVGVGVGFETKQGRVTDQIAIVVNVTQKVPKTALNAEDIIPQTLDDVPVDVVEVGTIRAW